MDVSGGAHTFDMRVIGSGYSPVYSPDGSKIAYVIAPDVDTGGRIFVMDKDGSDAVALTDGSTLDRDPDWSPDGSRIVFQSARDGNEEIYVMDADGSNPVRLTDETAADEQPVWSPDGTQIAFSSRRVGRRHIFVERRWHKCHPGDDRTG